MLCYHFLATIRLSDQKGTVICQKRKDSVWPIMKWIKAIGIVSTTPLSNPNLLTEWALSCMKFLLILLKYELISILECIENETNDGVEKLNMKQNIHSYPFFFFFVLNLSKAVREFNILYLDRRF